jgi:hypothetical protein
MWNLKIYLPSIYCKLLIYSVFNLKITTAETDLPFALNDEELLTKIEVMIRTAGGNVTRGPRS